MKKYKLIILFGKAGAGKDYLLRKLYDLYSDDLNLIISDTTRPPRLNELDGESYNFLTEEEFFKKDHIEYANFNNWYYGTPTSTLNPDKINIGIMNPDGIRQIYNREDLDIRLFYISAADKNRLYRQLSREKYPNVSEICRRYLADEDDFKNLHQYPYVILRNNNYDNFTQNIDTIHDAIEQLKSDLDRMK